MAHDKSYPWQCVRDGADAADVAANPNPLATQHGHTEWHDSYSGVRVPAPSPQQPGPISIHDRIKYGSKHKQ